VAGLSQLSDEQTSTTILLSPKLNNIRGRPRHQLAKHPDLAIPLTHFHIKSSSTD
jgi:hypothetical protein